MGKSKDDKKTKTPGKPKEIIASKDNEKDKEPEVKAVQKCGSHANMEKKLLKDIQCLSRLLTFTVVLFLSFATRLVNLSDPTHICWDETHFGKHANFYIKGEFFFDVHPPLAKMLIAMAGSLSGYNGSFPFDKPGDPYGENSYVGMRFLCALLGSLCIPLAYLMVWELTKSTTACILATGFILFDHGCITISQYILLDPILMFFIMLSAYCLTKFHSYKNNSYSFKWWFWMIATGIALSCAFSCKWVGLFVILWAGITTVMELWEILGNLELSLIDVGKHFAARVFGLIIVPVMVYLFWFSVHFRMLPNTGPGDGFFSSAFQSTLKGNQLYMTEVPEDLAFGSVVTIKNHRGGGALLHSHPHLYPKEHPPEQQQVTGYSHKDDNNKFIIKKAYEEYDSNKPVEFVKDGDWIRLEHVSTKRNVHSHNEKPPLTKHHMQVTAYGENGKGDANDFWKIEVISGGGDRIKTVKTIFRLIHVNLGCALHMSTKTLPKWGWEQLEVTCNPSIHHTNNQWNIEGHENDRVPKASPSLYKPSFLESVYESHIVMAQTNAGFKPKEGEVTSQPWQWPINYKGQVFSGGDNRVYLLGNPVIWWFIIAVLLYFAVVCSIFAVRTQRGYADSPQEQAHRKHVESICVWLLLAWALHYFPFYAMGRVLYFHHYFPAYLFSAMFAGIVSEYMCDVISSFFKVDKWKMVAYYVSVGSIVGMSIVSFYLFRGLSYGMSGPMAHSPNNTAPVYKWLDSWEV
ncbi:protein O-mannosyl-transferase 2 isoform X2 [Exaiptasia diaphana]|uniref:Protein O-mannosyl-transferase 2 n=1 Tax=Exaiptasia diaphana TaxID=2652724 RepID=A0A913XB89_EXADI|nr:protein O-mannosyl-transferase 2 isoform X2 [Exaiptasia diaphana]KXJ13379.1 Protein O-mannosyl-transferase 2 [Exaiptasia diaphana]